MAAFLDVARTQLNNYTPDAPARQGSGVLARAVTPTMIVADVDRPPVDSRRLARMLLAQQRSTLDATFQRIAGGRRRKAEEEGDSEGTTEGEDEDTSFDDSSASSDCEGTGEAVRPLETLRRFCPLPGGMLSITLQSVRADIFAGLTVCVMVIPQSMSYAKIVGVPYIYGMYSACVPALVYALFGDSRQLAVGPVAMTSLILRAGLSENMDAARCGTWDPDADGAWDDEFCGGEYLTMSFTVAALVGLIMIGAFMFRLGFLISFLGHPMVSGFTTGAAIIIGLSQLKYFVGFPLPSSTHAHELVFALLGNITEVKPAPLVLGLLWLCFLVQARKLAKRDKRFQLLGPLGPLLGCVVGSVLMWAIPALHERFHVARVGEVPGGLFPVSIDKLQVSWELFNKVKITAVSAALISFMESIAIAKALAAQHDYDIRAGQELFALGVTNLVGSMFSCFCVTGSFSRSAVANATGAQTQMAGIITGVGMLLVLLLLTPIFYHLPMFALAAIVINSVMSLVAYDVAIELYTLKRWDFGLWFVAFLGTLFVGPLEGIGIAVVMSICVVIYESVRPQLRILWRVPGTKLYRSIEEETAGQFVPGALIVQLSSSLYFANVSYVKDVLLQCVADVSKVDAVQYLVLEMTSVYRIDSTAAHLLMDVVRDCRARGVELGFANVGRKAMRTFRKAGLDELIGEDLFFHTVDDAIRWYRAEQNEQHEDPISRVPSQRPSIVHFSVQPEVGISNDMHMAYTQVHVGVPRTVVGLVSLIRKSISASGCVVLSTTLDHTNHTYQVSKEGRKLTPREADELRATLEELLRGIYADSASPHSSDIIPHDEFSGIDCASLLQAIAAERAKVEEGELARRRLQAMEAALQSREG